MSKFKKFIDYLSSFPKVFSENSTKLFSLMLSAIAGFFLAAIIIPFILIYDVIKNGYVHTDLGDLGVFVLCIGGLLAGAGFNVKVPEFRHHRKIDVGDIIEDIADNEKKDNSSSDEKEDNKEQ